MPSFHLFCQICYVNALQESPEPISFAYADAAPVCRNIWQQVFIADLDAFDALVLLLDEALPRHAQALEPSALSRWVDRMPAVEGTAASRHLDEEVHLSKRSRAIVSHVPRCAAAAPWFALLCVLSDQDDAPTRGNANGWLGTTYCRSAIPRRRWPVLLQTSSRGTPACRCHVVHNRVPFKIACETCVPDLCRKVVKRAAGAALRKDILVGFDAAQQLHAELTERLNHCAVFCMDALGGSVIGVKWKPKAWVPGPFRVATAHTSMPCLSGGAPGAFVTDATAVVQEIMQVGQGMVADVILCC